MMVMTNGESGIAPGCQEPRDAQASESGAVAEGVEQYTGVDLAAWRVPKETEKLLEELVDFVVEMKLLAPMLVCIRAELKRLELRMEALEEV